MGHQLLHAGLRRPALHVRRHRRQGRSQAHAHDRAGAVRDRVAAVGLRADARAADLRAGRDGPGRRRGHAADALHHLQRLRAGRTPPCDRPVGHGGRHRHRHRPGARRPAARSLLVGFGLPDQRAGDRRRHRRRGDPGAGVPQPRGRRDRLRGRAAVHRRPGAAGVRHRPGRRQRLLAAPGRYRPDRGRPGHPRPVRLVRGADPASLARRAAVPRPAALRLDRVARPGVLRHGRRWQRAC